jgi:hypothetical protein
MGVAHAVFAWSRLAPATITSKPMNIGGVEIAGTVLLAGFGAVLYLRGASPAGKAAGVAVAGFTPIGAALVTSAFLGFTNIVHARPRVGADIYNYSITWMALIGATAQSLAFLALARFMRRLKNRPGNVRT